MTDWKKFIPMNNLVTAHWYEAGVSADGTLNDYSGNNRHLTAATNKPVLTANVFKGHAGWYFNGSHDPMAWSGSVTMTHVFILASFEESAFTQFRGLLTGLSANWLLTSKNAGDEMLHHAAATPQTYYKDGVLFASAGMKAPMSGSFAIIEAVAHPSFTSFNGIQIGRNGNDATYLHRGHVVGSLIYSVEQAGEDRRSVYEYFASRYFAWQKNSSGLDVWPFQPEWGYGLISDKIVLSSRTVSNARKARSKSAATDGLTLVFEERTDEEYIAARKFWDEHYPGTQFIYRDDALSPALDRTVWAVSPIVVNKWDGPNKITYTIELLES